MNEFKVINFEKIKNLNKDENIKLDFEINIILLHNKNDKINIALFEQLKENKYNVKINVYDIDYKYFDNYFTSFERVKNELLKKKNKKIYIIISLYSNAEDSHLLGIIINYLKPNYLSYLFYIEKKPSPENIYFHNNHIKKYIYGNQTENIIIDDIIKKFTEIKSNYQNYLMIREKYIRILQEYDKNYRYKVIATSDDFINEGKNELEKIINEHKELLIEKIAQDISFVLCLSIHKKNEIKNLIQEDLKVIIEKNNDEIINSFLNYQHITDELKNDLEKYIKNIGKNNNNIILEKLEEQITNNVDNKNEIIAINGIPQIFNKDEFEEEEIKVIQNENNDDSDEGEDIATDYKDNNVELDNKSDYEQIDKENKVQEETIIVISFLTKEIKNKFKYSITLINLNLFYKIFCNIIRKIFVDISFNSISLNIIEGNQ